MPPFLIGIAILSTVAYLARGNKKVAPNGQVVSAAPDSYTTVNPASAGVVGPYTQLGVVTPANLPVLPGGVAMSSAPAAADVLTNPTSTNPGSRHHRDRAPAYQSFNFGPAHDLTKRSHQEPAQSSGESGGCGGCSKQKSCGSTPSQCGNQFTDGTGTLMSTSRAIQLKSSRPDSWLPMAQENVETYLNS